VRKEVDFGTSLATGPYRRSGLGAAVRAVQANPAAVRGLSDAVIVHIPAAAINDLLRQQPRFAVNLDRLVTERGALLESYSAEMA